jgi:hypothetical protein
VVASRSSRERLTFAAVFSAGVSLKGGIAPYTLGVKASTTPAIDARPNRAFSLQRFSFWKGVVSSRDLGKRRSEMRCVDGSAGAPSIDKKRELERNI